MRYLSLAIAIAILFCGCKKNDSVTTRPDKIWGQLQLYDDYTMDAGTHQLVQQAQFRSAPDTGRNVFVNEVHFSGRPLPADSVFTAYIQYEAQGVSAFASPAFWEVNGTNGIPSFSYTAAKTFPHFSGSLPKTLKVSDGLTFTLPASDFTATEVVNVSFDPGGDLIQKTGKPGSTFSFSTQELATLPTNTPVRIIVTAGNSDYLTVEGKTFEFGKIYSAYQAITIQ